MTVDDRYLTGVYYDMSTGDFYRIDRDKDTDEAILLTPDHEEVERLGPDEWEDEQDNFFLVPMYAIKEPVAYLSDWIDHQRSEMMEFDAGLIYADRKTEVVEVDDDE